MMLKSLAAPPMPRVMPPMIELYFAREPPADIYRFRLDDAWPEMGRGFGHASLTQMSVPRRRAENNADDI